MVAAVRRLRGSIPSQYLWPLLLLIGASFACIFLLLFLSAREQDTAQLEREQQALASVVDTATAMIRHDLQDYAKWDDAVRHISLRFEPDWVDDNVVAYLGRTQGYSEIFVLDEHNRTIYGFKDRHPAAGDAVRALGSEFAKSTFAVRKIPTSGSPIVSGFTRANGKVFLFSTAAVVPLTGKVRLRGDTTKLIVIARVLDDPLLSDLTKDLNLQDVRLLLNGHAPDRQAIAIKSPDGTRLAALEWSSHRPGSVLRRKLAPALGLLLLIALLGAGLILRRGGKAVEDLRQSELRARHLSDHDALTGLPNRRALVARIGDAIASGMSLALLFMDLDGFKDANDVYGHGAGDLLLRQAAGRIRQAAGEAFVARAGGDEFAVLLAPARYGEASDLAQRILAAFALPFAIGSYQVRLGVSIGFVEAPATESRQDELMRRADVAMYAAKGAGKNCVRGYLPSLDEGHLLRVRLEHDLRDAVEQEKIFVYYQPIVDTRTGTVTAVEALARWSDPVHGDVPPDVFIPIAEMSGLINAIGRHVLKTACRAMRDTDLELAVNLSPAQFWDGALLDEVRATLEETGFPPERLELEITESLMLRRPQVAAEVIDRLRSLGIRIALDDFGTGFASIGYLQQLKLDRLKIDKAFIAPIDRDPQAREMLVSITGLAKACKLEVCAEGIETETQAQVAQLAGCTRLQGWLYGKPQPARVIIEETRAAAQAEQHQFRQAAH
jgi:diguanylate cyclase (GGDEF)-like protein